MAWPHVMDFRVLGPLEVLDGDAPLPLGGRKPRALLARLLLDAGRTVSVDQLVDDLWGEDVPESAVKMVHIYVSQLRKALPAATLRTRPPGYSVELAPEAVDLARFERLRAEGRAALDAGDAATAAARLGAALALWRGDPLAEFSEPFAQIERAHLEEGRLACLEDRIDADLALGRHDDVVGELERLVARQPLRERLRGQLMLALYRAGRQADALAAYRDYRTALDDQLGLEPSPRIRELEGRILRQDAGL
jgi:DNA-binding SARP family transcriptional activator